MLSFIYDYILPKEFIMKSKVIFPKTIKEFNDFLKGKYIIEIKEIDVGRFVDEGYSGCSCFLVFWS